MQQFIFNYYVNEFGTYLFISQWVLYSVICQQEENAVTLPHSAQSKHTVFWKKRENVKNKEIAI